MLGSVALFGNFSCSIDSKSRIIIPSLFNAEKGEQVVFCLSDVAKNVIDVYPTVKISEIIGRYDEIIFNSTNAELILKSQEARNNLCKSVIEQATIESQRRLFINPNILSILGNPSRLYCLGEYNRVKIFGNIEQCEEYVGHCYVKR